MRVSDLPLRIAGPPEARHVNTIKVTETALSVAPAAPNLAEAIKKGHSS
jgi:hypothetical protein